MVQCIEQGEWEEEITALDKRLPASPVRVLIYRFLETSQFVALAFIGNDLIVSMKVPSENDIPSLEQQLISKLKTKLVAILRPDPAASAKGVNCPPPWPLAPPPPDAVSGALANIATALTNIADALQGT